MDVAVAWATLTVRLLIFTSDQVDISVTDSYRDRRWPTLVDCVSFPTSFLSVGSAEPVFTLVVPQLFTSVVRYRVI